MTTLAALEPVHGMLPVSVLVPTFNRAHYLGQAIDSLLGQDRPPAEIIVIDDGSDDDTAQIVSGYGARLVYIRQDNSGKSAALNRGLARASQPFIWIFDDDDVAAPHALGQLYAALIDCADAGYAYGLCDKFTGEWPCADREQNCAYRSDDHQALYINLLEDFFLWQGAMLVRRACYDAVGPFDTRLNRSQDYQMALRLVRAFPGVAVPIVAFHQRHHAGSRGPRDARFAAAQVDEVWRKFNHIIFREIHASHDLAEFCIGACQPLSRRERMTGYIQRGSIMARKGLWLLATDDFHAAAELARQIGADSLNNQEMSALRRIFQRGAKSHFDDAVQARGFFATLDGFPANVRGPIKGNLMLPITFRLRRARDVPFPRAEIRQLWMAGRPLLGGAMVRHYLRARQSGEAMFKVEPLAAVQASIAK